MGESSGTNVGSLVNDPLLEPDDDWKELGTKCQTEARFRDLTACLMDKYPDEIEELSSEFFTSLPDKLIKESDLAGLVEEVLEDAIKLEPHGKNIGIRCGKMWEALSKVVDTKSYDFEVLLHRAFRKKSIDVLEWFAIRVANPVQLISIRDWIDELEDDRYDVTVLLAIVEERLTPFSPSNPEEASVATPVIEKGSDVKGI